MKVKLKPYPDFATFSIPQAEGKFQMTSTRSRHRRTP